MHLNVVRQKTKRKVICNILCVAATTSITKFIIFFFISCVFVLVVDAAAAAAVVVYCMHTCIGQRFAVISYVFGLECAVLIITILFFPVFHHVA